MPYSAPVKSTLNSVQDKQPQIHPRVGPFHFRQTRNEDDHMPFTFPAEKGRDAQRLEGLRQLIIAASESIIFNIRDTAGYSPSSERQW